MKSSNDLLKDLVSDLKKTNSLSEIEQIDIKYFGRNGIINDLMKGLKSIKPEERGPLGKEYNETKKKALSLILDKKNELINQSESSHKIDVTLPGKAYQKGSLHLVTYAIEEIARIFGVPASMIGAKDGIKSSVEQEYQDFYARTLASYAINIEQELARKLLTENDKLTYYFKFNFNSLLRASANERADYYNKGIRGGWLSRNEARMFEDANGFDGGDEYLIESNLMPSSKIDAYMDAKIAQLMSTADKNNNPEGTNNTEVI